MMFVRHKTVKGRRYYQLVRNFREDGNHRQEVLCHLGLHDSIDAAIEAERQRIAPTLEYYEALANEWYRTVDYGEREMEALGTLEVLDQAEARQRLDQLPDVPEHREKWLQAYRSLVLHEARAKLAEYEGLAAARRARLDKLLECKEKYF